MNWLIKYGKKFGKHIYDLLSTGNSKFCTTKIAVFVNIEWFINKVFISSDVENEPMFNNIPFVNNTFTCCDEIVKKTYCSYQPAAVWFYLLNFQSFFF